MSIRIEKAQPSHAGEVCEMIREMAADSAETTPLTEEYVTRFLRHAGSGVLIAMDGGRAVGLLSFSIMPGLFHASDSCVIEALIVRKDRRGQGIGGMLVSRVIEEAREKGCAEMSVSTGMKNERAIALYKKHGLTEEYLSLEKHF